MPSVPLIVRVDELRQTIEAGQCNLYMAAGQLIADGYPVDFEDAKVLMIVSTERIADVVTASFSVSGADAMRRMVSSLNERRTVPIEPGVFVAQASNVAGRYQRGVIGADRATQELSGAFGLSPAAAGELLADLRQAFNVAMFDRTQMRNTCNSLMRERMRSQGGVVAF
jgi:hypothetical protein